MTKIYTMEKPAIGYKFNLNTGVFKIYKLCDILDKEGEPLFHRRPVQGKYVEYRVFKIFEDGVWKDRQVEFPKDAKQIYITTNSVAVWAPRRGKNVFESFRKACVKGLEEKLDRARKHQSDLAKRIEKLLANKDILDKWVYEKNSQN